MFKSNKINSKHRVLRKKVNIFEAPDFGPYHGATALATKMCANPHEDSMFIRFLWSTHTKNLRQPYSSSQNEDSPNKFNLKSFLHQSHV